MDSGDFCDSPKAAPGPQTDAADEFLPVEPCLACGHLKLFHRNNSDACSADPRATQEFASASYSGASIEFRKKIGHECWCWKFCNDPKEASDEIRKHGDDAAIRRGIDDAIDRRDSASAKRLKTRLLRRTGKQERDDDWLRDVEQQISALEASSTQSPASPSQDPAVWESLRRDFESLADAELHGDPNNRGDRWLRAYANEGEGNSKGRTVYSLRSGLNERFRETFALAANKAGIALGLLADTDALERWLRYVFAESRKHKSKHLKVYRHSHRSGSGPVINDESLIMTRICEASAVCCSRLEQQSLQMAARKMTSSSDQGSSGASLPSDGRHARDEQREAVIKKIEDSSKHKFLTIPEAALYFDVKPRTIHRWKGEGKLRDGVRRGSITTASARKLQRDRSKPRAKDKDL